MSSLVALHLFLQEGVMQLRDESSMEPPTQLLGQLLLHTSTRGNRDMPSEPDPRHVPLNLCSEQTRHHGSSQTDTHPG
jgi:hypothetical protein